MKLIKTAKYASATFQTTMYKSSEVFPAIHVSNCRPFGRWAPRFPPLESLGAKIPAFRIVGRQYFRI